MRRVGGVSRGVREDAVGIYEGMMASSRTAGEQAGRGRQGRGTLGEYGTWILIRRPSQALDYTSAHPFASASLPPEKEREADRKESGKRSKKGRKGQKHSERR
ncbi:hypothetical protein ROHU_015547 [Labeo rohita]|uniref:Uncharacterized protein n=1 Tax=Labeo rohita TaxID=84645 RepID=A0A498LXR4_LABRO|nr:hypothetical protein ROHU_031070 [Labeo rohita]RXN33487.1 hypothetical protein ROHU_015547 [Labeo rohita]